MFVYLEVEFDIRLIFASIDTHTKKRLDNRLTYREDEQDFHRRRLDLSIERRVTTRSNQCAQHIVVMQTPIGAEMHNEADLLHCPSTRINTYLSTSTTQSGNNSPSFQTLVFISSSSFYHRFLIFRVSSIFLRCVTRKLSTSNNSGKFNNSRRRKDRLIKCENGENIRKKKTRAVKRNRLEWRIVFLQHHFVCQSSPFPI